VRVTSLNRAVTSRDRGAIEAVGAETHADLIVKTTTTTTTTSEEILSTDSDHTRSISAGLYDHICQ